MPNNDHNNEEPTPIYSFDGLKDLLRSLGYNVGNAEGYRPLPVTDLGESEIRNILLCRMMVSSIETIQEH
jgi:hypothetical protein